MLTLEFLIYKDLKGKIKNIEYLSIIKIQSSLWNFAIKSSPLCKHIPGEIPTQINPSLQSRVSKERVLFTNNESELC